MLKFLTLRATGTLAMSVLQHRIVFLGLPMDMSSYRGPVDTALRSFDTRQQVRRSAVGRCAAMSCRISVGRRSNEFGVAM